MTFRLLAVLWFAIAGTGCAEPSSTSETEALPIRPDASQGGRTVASFSFIGQGTTMQQVIATLGPPDGDVGSGIHIYVYRLADGTEVWIGSPDASEIWYARHESQAPEKSTSIYERK